jgi:hypothetical protein
MVKYRDRIQALAPVTEAASNLQSSGSGAKLPTFMSLAAKYGLDDDMNIGNSGTNEQTVEQEYQAYITSPLSASASDIIKFWEVSNLLYLQILTDSLLGYDCYLLFQMSSTVFPTIFAIAMDYLPIQASSVSCERVFSSSAETDTKKRNRISPLLMEALQMLKYHFKKERLNLTEHWSMSESELMDDDPEEEDLLGKLLQDNYQASMDKAMKSIMAYESL